MRTLRIGSVGPEVAIWQRIVGTKVDEHYGPISAAATRAWQTAYGLTADGIVGERTWAAAGYAPQPAPRVAVWPSVPALFVEFSCRCEGVINHLYLDTHNPPLVTTAIGCLADPLPLALPMPFVLASDMRTPATPEQIAVEWATVKSHPELSDRVASVMKPYCHLRLTPAGIEQVMRQRLDGMVAAMCKRFPDFSTWPADAQIATLGYAWARGSAFVAPKLVAALFAQDFAQASAKCTIRETGNAGVIRRNKAQRAMYDSAAEVVAGGMDRSVVRFDVSTVR